jgi:hypothetical protein
MNTFFVSPRSVMRKQAFARLSLRRPIGRFLASVDFDFILPDNFTVNLRKPLIIGNIPIQQAKEFINKIGTGIRLVVLRAFILGTIRLETGGEFLNLFYPGIHMMSLP